MQGEDQLDGGREARGGKRAKGKGHGKTDRAAGLREPESPEEDGKELLGKSPKLLGCLQGREHFHGLLCCFSKARHCSGW